MIHPNPSTALARIVVDELTRAGVELVVASPGSRSTALALAVLHHPDLELVVTLDERSAGFQALGRAKAARGPAAVLTTSGTAVANLLPAVVEADLSETSLVVLSSDRPGELRGVGANQAIEQVGIFGGFVRFSVDLGPGEAHPDAPRWWRSSIAQGMARALGFGSRPGPVQFNLAFREPTVPVADDGRTRADPYPYDNPGRPHRRAWTAAARARAPEPDLISELVSVVGGVDRGVIVAGVGADGAGSIPELGERLGWPVLATAESGLRGTSALATGHHLAGRQVPDLVLRFGSPGSSRRLLDLVSAVPRQVVVGAAWSDPGRTAELVVDAAPAAVAAALSESVPAGEGTDWMRWWVAADRAVRQVLEPELTTRLTEPAVAAAVGRSAARALVVASSMPIRDVENYAFAVPPVVANRGASGIDGFVSTALGVAGVAGPTVALTGDLSLLHDSNGFLCEPRPPCVFVVIDNSGGGIFSFLPQAEHAREDFERLFGTPHGRRLDGLAKFHGLGYRSVETPAELDTGVREALGGADSSMIVVTSDRAANVAEHLRLARIVDEALAGVPDPA